VSYHEIRCFPHPPRFRRRHGGVALFGQRADGVFAHGGPGIAEQRHQVRRFERRPSELKAARVVHLRHAVAADAVNGTEHIGLGELRRRATGLIAAAGYEPITVTLKSGQDYAGILKEETDTQLTLNSPEDGSLKLKKSGIARRGRGLSAMPEGLDRLLSKRELRNLIEFVATRPAEGTKAN